jgi:hypothetical protein
MAHLDRRCGGTSPRAKSDHACTGVNAGDLRLIAAVTALAPQDHRAEPGP